MLLCYVLCKHFNETYYLRYYVMRKLHTAELRGYPDGNHWNRTDGFGEPFYRVQRKEPFEYMTVLIMASLFHDPLDSQAPLPCTLKSAPLAKIKPLGNTGAHKCSGEAPSFQVAFAA